MLTSFANEDLSNLKICVITFCCKFMFQLFDLSILMVIIYFNLQIFSIMIISYLWQK